MNVELPLLVFFGNRIEGTEVDHVDPPGTYHLRNTLASGGFKPMWSRTHHAAGQLIGKFGGGDV
jgi:hypothetical protein